MKEQEEIAFLEQQIKDGNVTVHSADEKAPRWMRRLSKHKANNTRPKRPSWKGQRPR